MTTQERDYWLKYREYWIEQALTLRRQLDYSSDVGAVNESRHELDAVEKKIAIASDLLEDVNTYSHRETLRLSSAADWL